MAGLLYGVLTSAAFPPLGVWPLAFVAVVPLCWSACHAGARRSVAAVMVWLGTLPLWFVQERWLVDVTQLGYPLLAMYLSLYSAVFVRLLAGLRFRLTRAGLAVPLSLTAPVLWVGTEFVRGEIGLTGYPWFLAGHPLIESPTPLLAMPAAVLGAYSVSFLVVALAGALADAAGWSGARRQVGGVGAASVVLLWVALIAVGRWTTPAASGARTINAAVVQTNIPQDNKLFWTIEQRLRDWDQFAKLTRAAAKATPRPDLILWPETMFPGTALNPDYRESLAAAARLKHIDPLQTPGDIFIQRLEDLQRECGIPMLVGAQSIEGFALSDAPGSSGGTIFAHRYNSAFLVESGRVRADRYDKVELTPFGEVIPYLWRWKSAQAWIERAGAGGMKFDLTSGSAYTGLPLTIRRAESDLSWTRLGGDVSIRFITPICFEATKPAHCRALVRAALADSPDQPVLMVNLSNDGWFGRWSGGREQHLQASRWRCVELGLSMVRAVNTGISCAINPEGMVTPQALGGRELEVRTDGILVYEVLLHPPGGTLYTRLGDVLGWSMLGLTLLLPPLSIALSRRPRLNRGAAGA